MGRFRDWMATFTASARMRRLEREARELIQETADTLEKLNTAFARMAKRESRALVRRAEQLDLAPPSAAALPGEQAELRAVGGEPLSRKAALRRRVFGGRGADFPRPTVNPLLPGSQLAPGSTNARGSVSQDPPCDDCDDNPPAGV